MHKIFLFFSILCSIVPLGGCTNNNPNFIEEVSQMPIIDYDERSTELKFMMETYGFSEDELEGVDLIKFVEDFQLRERDFSAEEVHDILNAQKDMYIDDGSTALYSILSKDGRELRESDVINRMGLYLNIGTMRQQMVFDFEKDVYYINNIESHSLTQQQSTYLRELPGTCKIFAWDRHTEVEEEEESTGNFGWKIVIQTASGEYCTYDGYTRDGSNLPDSFNDFLSGIQRITEAAE